MTNGCPPKRRPPLLDTLLAGYAYTSQSLPAGLKILFTLNVIVLVAIVVYACSHKRKY